MTAYGATFLIFSSLAWRSFTTNMSKQVPYETKTLLLNQWIQWKYVDIKVLNVHIWGLKAFFSSKFCSIFGHQIPGSGLDPDRIQPRMLDPDPYQIMNTDAKHWLFVVMKYLRGHLCFLLAVLSCLLYNFIFLGPSVQALAALREKARCVIMYAGMIPYRNVFT